MVKVDTDLSSGPVLVLKHGDYLVQQVCPRVFRFHLLHLTVTDKARFSLRGKESKITQKGSSMLGDAAIEAVPHRVLPGVSDPNSLNPDPDK
jgi:hypothetical protein